MNNYYIVNQSQILIYDHVIDHVEVSETYPSNNHVKISEAQYQFHIDHPTASMQEVWNMEMTIYVDNRTQSEKRQEQYGLKIPTELSQAFITYRAEAVAYRLENNEALALVADAKANEKAQEIAAIKEQIRIEYPDTVW